MDTPTYSVENGVRFGWSSISGNLNPVRVGHLAKYVIGQSVLDAGCGGGAFVEYLCAQGFQVTGVDYYPEFLELARQRPGAKGTYLQGDVTALPFPDKGFDCSYCYDVLEHVDDHKALRELVRVTRRRIILAVPATDPNVVGGGLTFRHYQDLTHLRTYTGASLTELFQSAGLGQFHIIPELEVDFRTLAIQHLDGNSERNPVRAFGRRVYHAVLRHLIARARYRTIYSGLAAVIDLPN